MEIKKIAAEETYFIRHSILWPEKDLEYVKIPEDNEGLHYGLFEEGRLVSVISLFCKGKEARFRKFATLTEFQRKGYGTVLLQFMFQEARALGIQKMSCHSRSNASNFYKKFGMKETADVFVKEGMDYVVMEVIWNE